MAVLRVESVVPGTPHEVDVWNTCRVRCAGWDALIPVKSESKAESEMSRRQHPGLHARSPHSPRLAEMPHGAIAGMTPRKNRLHYPALVGPGSGSACMRSRAEGRELPSPVRQPARSHPPPVEVGRCIHGHATSCDTRTRTPDSKSIGPLERRRHPRNRKGEGRAATRYRGSG